MTKNQAQKYIENAGYKEVVTKIIDLVNGESLNDAVKLLEVAAFFIKEHSFVDADMAKSLITCDET